MWSDIESGILEMVLLLLNLAGVACVASVCAPWRRIVKSFARDHRLTVRHRSYLIISSRPYDQAIALMNPLYRPTNPLSRQFCGAFGDWLAINDMIDGVYLYHPLLHCVQLPPLTTPPLNIANNGFDLGTYRNPKYVRKVILSSPPTSAECLVAIIYGLRGLAFCRLGDSSWTEYGSDDRIEMWKWDDAVFHDGRLVAVDNRECVWSFGIRTGQIDRQLMFQPGFLNHIGKRFLVESMGHLLMVVKRLKLNLVFGTDSILLHLSTRDFKIFEFDMNRRGWMPLQTLGKRVMFVTEAMSTVVASDETEEDLGSDCIYYVEANKHSVSCPPDWVFYMADERLEQFPARDEVVARAPLFFSMFTSVRNR